MNYFRIFIHIILSTVLKASYCPPSNYIIVIQKIVECCELFVEVFVCTPKLFLPVILYCIRLSNVNFGFQISLQKETNKGEANSEYLNGLSTEPLLSIQ